MMATENNLQDKVRARNPLSSYAKFHFAFLGYSFLDTRTNKIKSKLQVFLRDKELAEVMTLTKETPTYYELVDSNGWENGNLLTN